MQGKRRMLARVLYTLGLPRFYLPRDMVIIVNYHRIAPDDPGFATSFDDGVFGPTQSQLHSQLSWLGQRTTVLSQEGLLDLCQGGAQPGGGPYSLVTFDDGYRDNYTLAWPVLRRLKLPAIFFLPTGYINQRRLGWWDRIAWLVKHSRKDGIEVDGRRLAVASDKKAAIAHLHQVVKSRRGQDPDALVEELALALEARLPGPEQEAAEIMTWEQAREVAGGGVALGSHSHSHRILSALDRDEQRLELEKSRNILESQTGRPVVSLAYPVGGLSHISSHTAPLALACGYRLLFTFNTGVNRLSRLDCSLLRRMAPENDLAYFACSVSMPWLFLYS